MIFMDYLNVWIILIFFEQTLGVPYNQPRFCSNASWDQNAVIFVNESVMSSDFKDIFITPNNTIYVADQENSNILVWSETSIIPIKNISLSQPNVTNVFLTDDNDIYFDCAGGICKWISNSSSDVSVMETCSRCYDIFIDIRNDIYCSMRSHHQVIRKSLNNLSNLVKIIAGIGGEGSTAYTLKNPNGIFIDTNFDLYVADNGNNRIQLFPSGQSHGITVAGNELLSITLKNPSGVILDANKYIFIVDSGNNRIVANGPNGFRCIVGCVETHIMATELESPRSISFDGFGNLFVIESTHNGRLLKFNLITNYCNETNASAAYNVTHSATNVSIIHSVKTSNGISYNRPKLDQYAVWNPDGIVLINQNIAGSHIYNIFINTNNTIYICDRETKNRSIQIWMNNDTNPSTTIDTSPTQPSSIFVTTNGDIYTSAHNPPYHISKWTLNANDSDVVMYAGTPYDDLFIDINNTLYCSSTLRHTVVAKSLSSASNILTIVAGTGCAGSASKTLSHPNGIFVDENFNLYVADSANHRIQLFRSGELNATTLAGNGSSDVTITLNCPIDVVLDLHKHLFIVDYGNNRIIGQGPHGFRCIVGCTGSKGSASNTLWHPMSMAFDIYGNIYVVDKDYTRIQKFLFSTISINQPKLCSNASWDSNGTTVANHSTIGSHPTDIFITTNNTIYLSSRSKEYIIVMSGTNPISMKNISINMLNVTTIFVTEQNDVYFDYECNSTNGIGQWISNSSSDVSVMETCSRCYDIFIDIRNDIYCSMRSHHQVIRKSLNNLSNPVKIIAGIGGEGSTAYTLKNPNGIFIDTNFDLYVADNGNNRIQLFPSGQSHGITVAGNESLNTTITLNGPSDIVLDANGYLFIVDSNNHRIVGSDPDGFRCLVGCNGNGSASDQLQNPLSISFDSFGNIFVIDEGNSRIQKFLIMTNSCNETTTFSANHVKYSSTDLSNLYTVNTSNGISYNQPEFHPYAVWNPIAVTFVNASTGVSSEYGIFININNTIYVVKDNNKCIQVWMNDSINPTITIDTNSISPNSIFVTNNGDIYTNNKSSVYEISKWQLQTNNSAVVMYADGTCYRIFIDINNILYCSISSKNKVVAKSLNDATNILTIVAGTGCAGNASNTLNTPYGIFVDNNFSLYVADALNHRIQLFRSGELNATTIAGTGSPDVTITLYFPIDVVLDLHKNLFIVDHGNNRIIGQGPHGFRCIVGCTGSGGSASNTLYQPTSIAFDSYGNIYVVEYGNKRIQKFLLLNNTLVPSYNQPKFCSNAMWDANATIFANESIIGSNPFTLFIDINDTIYAVNRNKTQILIWSNNSIDPSTILYSNLSDPKSIYVTSNGDMYVDNSHSVNRGIEAASYTNITTPIMNISSSCMGLFVDITNTLYCSVDTANEVFKKWLNDNTTTVTRVAGNGTKGSASNMLDSPYGIFVDTNFDLYVADNCNNRIQLFRLGDLNGSTVAGNSSSTETIPLNHPTNVILDRNQYLFIADTHNHRIIGSDENGFRCIVGCSNSSDSISNKLNYPRSIAFDSFGNLFVVDNHNHRILKFSFLETLCDAVTTQSSIITTASIESEPLITTDLTTSDEITTQESTLTLTTTIQVTTSTTEDISKSPIYFLSNCIDQNKMGTNCNISSTQCSLLNPCENNGTCLNTTTNILGYICNCVDGFDGVRCQDDLRSCKPNTCLHNGTCIPGPNKTFKCLCSSGWTGDHCEKMINYCQNVTCQNKGVCRPLFLNYKCECLGESFSGRHCEKVSTKTVILRAVSKSIGYIAIIVLVSTAAFFVIMDILKYCFGIDVTKDELDRIRRAKEKKKPKRRPVIQRSTNVHTLPAKQRSATVKNRKGKVNTV